MGGGTGYGDGSAPSGSAARRAIPCQVISPMRTAAVQLLRDARRRRSVQVFAFAFIAGLAALRFLSPSSAGAAPASITGLHVSGNQIFNAAGQPVRLLGVNRSGTEYRCIQSTGN